MYRRYIECVLSMSALAPHSSYRRYLCGLLGMVKRRRRRTRRKRRRVVESEPFSLFFLRNHFIKDFF